MFFLFGSFKFTVVVYDTKVARVEVKMKVVPQAMVYFAGQDMSSVVNILQFQDEISQNKLRIEKRVFKVLLGCTMIEGEGGAVLKTPPTPTDIALVNGYLNFY